MSTNNYIQLYVEAASTETPDDKETNKAITKAVPKIP